MTEQGKFIRVPEEMWFDDRLTGTEKLVLISLLCHLNHAQRRSWPSQEMIAKECGLSRKWVRVILRELEQRGYIDSFKEKGRGNQMIYALNPLPPRKKETETELPVTGTECRKEMSSQFTDSDPESGSNENSVSITQDKERGTQFPLVDTEKWELSSEKGELSSQLMGTQFPSKGNSVPTNQIKNQINNQTKNQMKERAREKTPALHSADPWTAAQLEKIRKVVEAPKPGKLPELLAQWRETYGAKTVEWTITRALRWMQDNGKRYTDMGRFIGNWLARDAEKRPAARSRQDNGIPDYGDTLPSWEELRGGGR